MLSNPRAPSLRKKTAMPCEPRRRKLYVPIYPVARCEENAIVHCVNFAVYRKPDVEKDYLESFARSARRLKLRGWCGRDDEDRCFFGYVEGLPSNVSTLKNICKRNELTVVLRSVWFNEQEIRGFTAVDAFTTLSIRETIPKLIIPDM